MNEQQSIADSGSSQESAGGDFFSAIEAAFEAGSNQQPVDSVAPEPEHTESKTPAENATADSVPEIKDGTEAEPTLPIDEPFAETTTDDGEDDGGLSGKAGKRFKQLKTELRNSNTELAQLRQQATENNKILEELRASNQSTEDFKKTIDTYEQTLAVTKLEATRAYKDAVKEPMVKIVRAANELAGRYKIDSDSLIEALGYKDRAKQDDALDNLLTGVKERDKLAIYALAEQVPLITAKRDQLTQNAAAALAELEHLDGQNQQAELAKQLEQRRAAAVQVRDKLISKVPFLKSIEGLDFDNVAKNAGDTDFNSLDVHNKVYSKIAGDMFPKMVREFASLRSELEEALDELESFKKSTPKTGGGAVGSASRSGSKSPGSFLDAINSAMGG